MGVGAQSARHIVGPPMSSLGAEHRSSRHGGRGYELSLGVPREEEGTQEVEEEGDARAISWQTRTEALDGTKDRGERRCSQPRSSQGGGERTEGAAPWKPEAEVSEARDLEAQAGPEPGSGAPVTPR